jgi:hypothetical protein
MKTLILTTMLALTAATGIAITAQPAAAECIQFTQLSNGAIMCIIEN